VGRARSRARAVARRGGVHARERRQEHAGRDRRRRGAAARGQDGWLAGRARRMARDRARRSGAGSADRSRSRACATRGHEAAPPRSSPRRRTAGSCTRRSASGRSRSHPATGSTFRTEARAVPHRRLRRFDEEDRVLCRFGREGLDG
jgi:hypothetical protein